MKKKLLSVLLTAVLLLGLTAPAFAAEATQDEAAQVLAALDIMAGDENGDLHLDRPVTRAEFVKLTIAASAYADQVGPEAAVSPYPDVPKSAWFTPYVQAAKEKGLVRGNTAGFFEPAREISLVEGVTLALRLLGYQDGDFSGAWGAGQMAMYRALKLDKGISLAQNASMTRSDALWLFYNLLTAPDKLGKPYLTTLGHSLTQAGEIDRVALINSAMDGPTVAEGNWQSAIPFDVSRAKVNRAIQPGDVVYWSKPMRTLWAYSDKATGAIQALAPNAVTVGGRTYSIESASVAYLLSDLGPYKSGDVVTLLLGRTGGVAAVRAPGAVTDTVYGVVTAIGTGTFQDAGGKPYTAGTLTLTATDGGSYTYRWEDKNIKPETGDLIQVSSTATGVTVKRLSKKGGIGAYKLAADAEILDTYGKTVTLRVYPARLAGVTLTDDMVRFYALNAKGEVDRLILNDVTGDLHRYGVLTDVTEVSFDMTLTGNYVYDIGGVPGAYRSDKAIWGLEKGPCQVKPDRIYNLTEAGQNAPLADNATVYELRDKVYYLTDLSRVNGGNYTLTRWQDKPEAAGGRVRVIIAKAN